MEHRHHWRLKEITITKPSHKKMYIYQCIKLPKCATIAFTYTPKKQLIEGQGNG